MPRAVHLKSGLLGVDEYQDGYYSTEAEARAALNAIAEVHRLEGRAVYRGEYADVPEGFDGLVVVGKVDREWR